MGGAHIIRTVAWMLSAVLFLAMALITMTAAQAWAQGTASEAGAIADAIEKVAGGHPMSLLVLGAIVGMVWKAWREDTVKHREQTERMTLIIERSNAEFAKSTSDLARSLDRQTEAVNSMKGAVEELDRSIRDRAHKER